jgi:diguanylate cyclase
LYEVYHAEEIEEAKNYFFKVKVHVILLDLNLKNTKGRESFDQIKKLNMHIPVIVLTGLRDLELESYLIKAGAQDYIPKNRITSFNLSASIFHAIERQKQMNEIFQSDSSNIVDNIKPKVLVVDDKKENITSMKVALKRIDAEIYTALSGNEALALMLDNEFAVVLLDVQMPIMDGFETATFIRSNEATKNTPIIFISAINKDEIYISKGYESGAIDYLFKPINVDILISKVNVFIGLYISNKRNNMSLLNSLKEAKLELEEKNKELEFLAKNDTLTKLANRYCFEREINAELAASKRHKRIFALLLIDIDNFKWINDNFGHDNGDIVLKHIAEILNSVVRKDDFAARIGGDEFAIVLSSITKFGDAGDVATKIMKYLRKQLLCSGHRIDVSVSIGISVYSDNINDIKDMVKQADIAMYKAKNSGRNCFKYYSEEIDLQYNRINVIKTELNKALERNELTVLFQPIMDLRNNRIIGVESLLRWNNSELGDVSPNEFISIAEETGAINSIGFWVIEETMKMVRSSYKNGIKDFFYSINLSPVQLENDDFSDELLAIIKKYKPFSNRIDFELTESSLSKFLKSSEMECLNFLQDSSFNSTIKFFRTQTQYSVHAS